MKKNNNDKIKVIMGLMILFLVAVAVLALFKPIPDKQNVVAANEGEQTTNEVTTTEAETDTDTVTEPEAATALQAVTTEYIPVAHEIAELPTTTATTDRPAVTTSPPQTTVSVQSKKETTVTTTKTVEVTLAPVEIPDEEVMSILEEYDITIPETPTTTTQTTPPPTSGMPEGAQGTDEYGSYYKRVDGVKYVWDPVLSWIKDSENGSVEIVRIESDGYTFYQEPDGSINLKKVVSPDGKVISYDEYIEISESR